MQCGLSRELLYYAFYELNLRLPTNLDTTGIIPYPPPFFVNSSPKSLVRKLVMQGENWIFQVIFSLFMSCSFRVSSRIACLFLFPKAVHSR